MMARASEDKRTREARILESYRALDTLAAAVFQTGFTVSIAGVTIGLTVASRYSELVVVGGFISFFAAILAVLAMMIDFGGKAPDIDRFAEKKDLVKWATGSLVFGLLAVVIIFLILLASTEASGLVSLLKHGK
jgi:hypothetical protein